MLTRKQILSKMLIMVGCLMFVPLMLLIVYSDELKYGINFVIPGCISIVLGLMVPKIFRRLLSNKQTVVFVWLWGFFIATLPFYLNGGLNFVQALFESVSGFTTTGLSLLDVEKLPHIYLFYRAFLQYVGGIGFVMMILLFIDEKDAVSLYYAEGHPDKLMPSIFKTAKIICLMYLGLLVFGVTGYMMLGMNWLDAVVHAMCALSTGGFSNRLSSIGYYQSVPIEFFTVILMLAGTTNFSLLLMLFRGKIKNFFASSEIRFMLGILAVFIPMLSVVLFVNGFGINDSLRCGFFNVFSALSTTGYCVGDYLRFGEQALFILILLMLMGGGMGSTAGGIKLARVTKVCKYIVNNIESRFASSRKISLIYYNNGKDKEVLERKDIDEALTYMLSYLMIFVVGTLLLNSCSRSSLLYSAFEFASALGTVGLSIGVTSMSLCNMGLIIEIAGMILGRLEIFVIFEAFIKRS